MHIVSVRNSLPCCFYIVIYFKDNCQVPVKAIKRRLTNAKTVTLYIVNIEYKTVIRMHCGIYEFYKPSGP